jgi:SWI/SNF-related matrix-associated actin-dependent regulator of chromatin subfamily A member 5
MSDEGKEKYFELERKDRERFEEQSTAADAERLAEQEQRRQGLVMQKGEVASSRGARQKLDEERKRYQDKKERDRVRREAEMDDDDREERERAKAAKRKEIADRQRKRAEEEEALSNRHKKLDKEQTKKASQRLEYLFKQSPIFAKLKMGKGSMDDKEPVEEDKKRRGDDKKKPHHIHEGEEEEEEVEEEDEAQHVFLTQQPKCIEHGQLKPYQVESLNWMIHLSEKGLNGILADEVSFFVLVCSAQHIYQSILTLSFALQMGLGKTLQSISIMAYYWEYRRIQGPHLVCVPKSTLSNWMNELKRWCPSLRVIRFHGSREDREQIVDDFFHNEAAAHDGRRPDRQIMDETGKLVDDNSENPRQWDVCVTTYEVCNAEKKVLQKFAWKYLIIDEAHRLKNDASMFSQTVRSFGTSNRLLLTG